MPRIPGVRVFRHRTDNERCEKACKAKAPMPSSCLTGLHLPARKIADSPIPYPPEVWRMDVNWGRGSSVAYGTVAHRLAGAPSSPDTIESDECEAQIEET